MKANRILRNEIISRLVKKESHLLGVEVESIVYDSRNRRLPVDRQGVYNSIALVDDLISISDPGNPVDIYSLEPGGQIEWASQPARSLTAIQEQFDNHLARLSHLLNKKDLFSIDLSLDPLYLPEEVDLVLQEKYSQMDEVFSKTGEHGRWMMRNSTSTQINIDYTSIEEAEEMAFLADCVQPIASVLFANSPFTAGTTTGNKNARYNIWLDTDPVRCGSLFSHGITEKEGLLDRFCEMVLKAPVIFTRNDNDETGFFSGTAREWIQSKPHGTSESTLAKTALHQIFTHVRFKHVIEVRGCDRPPFGYELAPAAFWSGLLIDNEARNEALATVEDWSTDDRSKLERAATWTDTSQIGPSGKQLSEWIYIFTNLALKGLSNRSGRTGCDESCFLGDFLEMYNKKGPPAKYLQDKFDTAEELLNCYKSLKPGENCGW